MSTINVLDNNPSQRDILTMIVQDLETKMFMTQTLIHKQTQTLASIKNQLNSVYNKILDYDTRQTIVPQTHSDPSTEPEIIIKPKDCNCNIEKVESFRHPDRLKVRCSICGEVYPNRLRLKEHKYQNHSYSD